MNHLGLILCPSQMDSEEEQGCFFHEIRALSRKFRRLEQIEMFTCWELQDVVHNWEEWKITKEHKLLLEFRKEGTGRPHYFHKFNKTRHKLWL